MFKVVLVLVLLASIAANGQLMVAEDDKGDLQAIKYPASLLAAISGVKVI